MAKKPTGSKQVPTVRPGAVDQTKTTATPKGVAPNTSTGADIPEPGSAKAPATGAADAPAPGKVATASPTQPLAQTPVSTKGTDQAAKSHSTASKTSAPPKSATIPAVSPKQAPRHASDANVIAKAAPEVLPELSVNASPTPKAVKVKTAPVTATSQEPATSQKIESKNTLPNVPMPESAPEQEPARAPETQSVPEPIPEPPRAPSRPSLFIVHITPELAAVAKVGGLADVVFGLSRELAIRGNHVEIILPKYASMRYDQIFEMQEVYKDLWVPWYDGAIHCTVFFGFVHDRKCFFIEPHSSDNFFNRGSIYGFKDDVLRYAFFSRAAMEFLWKSGKHPDVIHCHDWQTALVPVFLYEFYQSLGMTHPRVCLTIHNFAHQGVTGVELLHATGLHRPERFFDSTRMADNRHPKALNLLKGGIVYANFVTTVSPRYAFETKDQGQGFGLESTLHTHHIKYGGVVNGIDYDIWNPEIDRHIPVHYGIDSIDGKYDNKRALRHRLMLADNDKPIVAFIGRLDPQKGLDLVRHAIFYTLERGAQFVLLGSSPDDRINSDFWNLKQMLNESPDCHLEIGFDEDLSHLIYAGADMMLVPSRFEPCGLTQLISLRYGTIPVVRAIGGLADTVFDKDFSDRPLHARNGYVFQDYDNPGLESALGRAIACYRNHPDHFRELMKNAMRSDYSWNVPGQDYLNIYDYIRDV
jgi:starch synthase